MGLVAWWPVGFSWTRDQTHVLCIGRQTPNHWTIRELISPIYLELDLLVHGDFHLFGFRRYCHHFPKFSYQRIPPLAGFEGSSYSVSTPTLAIVFFILVFLVSKYYWYCSILLLCLSLITYKLKHFLMFIGHLDFVKCLFCCPFFCWLVSLL